MGKIVRTVVLTAAMAALVAAGGVGTAPAQVKDKSKPARADKYGTVEIYEAKDGFRFRVKDADGRVLAMPAKGFDKKDDVVKALEAIRATLNNVKPTEVKAEKKK